MNSTLTRRSLVAGGVGVGALALVGAPSAMAASTQPSTRALQLKLASLGYWLGAADGVNGQLTTQAVMAAQKVMRTTVDGVAGPRTWGGLNKGYRPSARSKADGIEIDLQRQIAMVVRGGKVKLTLNTSTGSGEWFWYFGRQIRATTPRGNFRVYSAYSAGWQSGVLGPMYRPYYFNGGIALHGSLVIPGYPASHGCCRVSTNAQDMLIRSGYLKRGTSVRVY